MWNQVKWRLPIDAKPSTCKWLWPRGVLPSAMWSHRDFERRPHRALQSWIVKYVFCLANIWAHAFTCVFKFFLEYNERTLLRAYSLLLWWEDSLYDEKTPFILRTPHKLRGLPICGEVFSFWYNERTPHSLLCCEASLQPHMLRGLLHAASYVERPPPRSLTCWEASSLQPHMLRSLLLAASYVERPPLVGWRNWEVCW